MSIPSPYQPLDPSRQEIRLIEIHSPITNCSDKSVKISCTLHTVSLLDKPEFIALSYVWGDPSVTEEILVNGLPFQATVNLVAGLRQAVVYSRLELPHKAEGSFRFWADAISISQSDLDEKNHQIPLMKSIYSGAQLVVGSVGHGDDAELALGLEALDGLCHAWIQYGEQGGGDTSLRGLVSCEWLRGCPHVFEGRASSQEAKVPVACLIGIVTRPYFSRVWVAQELMLATSSTLVCDVSSVRARHVATIPHIHHFLSWLQGKMPAKPAIISVEAWGYFANLEYGLSFIEQYYRGTGTEDDSDWEDERDPHSRKWNAHYVGLMKGASDERDRVYGVLGVSELPIEVDYAKSVTAVYADLARACLEDGGDMEFFGVLLNLAGVGPSSRDDCPSWVPRPADNLDGLVRPRDRGASEPFDDRWAEERKLRAIQHLAIDWSLHWSGVRFQRVARVHPSLFHSDNSPTAVSEEEVIKAVRDIRRQRFSNSPKRDPLQIWAQTICQRVNATTTEACIMASLVLERLGINSSGSQPDSDNHGCVADNFLDELGTAYRTTYWSPEARLEMERNAMSALISIEGLAIFETVGGLLGLGPKGTEVGDMVCVLEMMKCPQLLRKAAGDHFVLVGTCFVLGLMEGEILEYIRDGTVRVEELIIR